MLMFLLSTLAAMNVATKSLPEFLSLGGYGVKLLHAGIGLFQGVLNGFALPSLANKVGRCALRGQSITSDAGPTPSLSKAEFFLSGFWFKSSREK